MTHHGIFRIGQVVQATGQRAMDFALKHRRLAAPEWEWQACGLLFALGLAVSRTGNSIMIRSLIGRESVA